MKRKIKRFEKVLAFYCNSVLNPNREPHFRRTSESIISVVFCFCRRKLEEILGIIAIGCWSSYIQILSVRSHLAGDFWLNHSV